MKLGKGFFKLLWAIILLNTWVAICQWTPYPGRAPETFAKRWVCGYPQKQSGSMPFEVERKASFIGEKLLPQAKRQTFVIAVAASTTVKQI